MDCWEGFCGLIYEDRAFILPILYYNLDKCRWDRLQTSFKNIQDDLRGIGATAQRLVWMLAQANPSKGVEMTVSGNDNDSPIFKQTNWTVQGDVYNVAGDLILSKEGDAGDFMTALEGLRNDLQNLQGLDPVRQQAINMDLNSVVQEATGDQPVKDIIVGRLNTVRATLEASSKTVKEAWELSKVVSQVAIWAAAFFA